MFNATELESRLNGSNIMCPGFTSPGGRLDNEIDEGMCVAIKAEGKEHALAIGLTKMSTARIREENNGIGVENLHYLADGLWATPFLA